MFRYRENTQLTCTNVNRKIKDDFGEDFIISMAQYHIH